MILPATSLRKWRHGKKRRNGGAIVRHVSDAELQRRAAAPAPKMQRGYRQLFMQHVTQADQGCDFDFLRATRMTAKVPSKQ